MAGSLMKVEAFATQMWLKIQLLETLAKVRGLDNCGLLVSKQLKVLIMNVASIEVKMHLKDNTISIGYCVIFM